MRREWRALSRWPNNALVKDRCSTLEQMAWISMFYVQPSISDEDRAQHLTGSAQAACVALASALNDVEWTAPTIAAAMKSVLADRGMKMPQLAILCE